MKSLNAVKMGAWVVWCIVCCAVQAATQGGQTTVYTVGTDKACDFDVIQDAIDAVPDNSTDSYQIRVTNQQVWNEHLFINNKDNLRMDASFADCTDAENYVISFSSPAILSDTGALNPGLFINNSQNVSLQGFKVSGFALGGLTILASEVSMNSMDISQNLRSNTAGGGLYIGSNSTVRVSRSLIANNTANHGGGIYCSAGLLSIHSSEVINNQTNVSNGMGGGLLLDDGCIGRVFSFKLNSVPPTRISQNTAHQYGGGVAVDDGARLETNTSQVEDQVAQVFITENLIENPINSQLNSAGAGIYARGNGSVVQLHATVLANNNFADLLQFVGGAAMAINDQASLSIQNRGVNYCIDAGSTERNCNQIKGHHVSNGDAAMIKIAGGATAQIHHTSIFDNQTGTNSNQLASVIDGSLTMQGNFVYDNGTRPNGQFQQPTRLIRVSTNGTFYGDFLTFTDNRLWGGWVIQAFNSSSVNLTRSIIAEDNNEQVFLDSISQPSQTKFECLLTHESASFTGTDITVGPPDFEGTRPLHISAHSDAVDLCDNNISDLLPAADIDGDERGPCPGLCSPNRFDAGADEFTASDLIFKNGFKLLL